MKSLKFNILLILMLFLVCPFLYAGSAKCMCAYGLKYHKHHHQTYLEVKPNYYADDFAKSLRKKGYSIIIPSSTIAGMHDSTVGLYGGAGACINVTNCRNNCVALCKSLLSTVSKSEPQYSSLNESYSKCRFDYNATDYYYLQRCSIPDPNSGIVPAYY